MRLDLVYSIDTEKGQTTFTAKSRGGHEFMDKRTFTVPNEKVDEVIKQAEADGLVVVADSAGAIETVAPFALDAVVQRSNLWQYLFRRWMGTLIDYVVLFLFLLIPDYVLGNLLYQQTLWIWVSPVILYFPILEGVWGRTLGKLLAGTVVVDIKGNAPGVWKAVLRTITRFVEVNPVGAGGLPAGIVAAMSQRRQRLGDMLAGTYVVRVSDMTLTGSAITRS